VGQALGGSRHVRARLIERQWRVVAAEHEVASRPRGEVEHHVDLRGADPLDHVAVERHVP
jgi:hypothetical protein